ncbi:enoyl-CoA hydratase/isomerase family protein [Alloalcanivorax sp. C16-1]|uniref:enoyl-CoA hydratase/isomerase family protein n=1 Tax=Alloalcanivorax sp. C16-1 TaxID=3390051 RepID=UPI003970E3A5
MISVERVSKEIALLTINRPPANALSRDLIVAIKDSIREFGSEPEPPALILSGEGDKFFSAGGDIREITEQPDMAIPRMREFHRMLCEVEHYAAPLICAVNGYAVGGALEIVLHADYVICSDNASFGFPEINHGLLPAAKGILQCAHRLGRRTAEKLLYSGDLISAQHAVKIGLVNKVVPIAGLAETALREARALRGKDLHLFSAIKGTLNNTVRMMDPELEEYTIRDMVRYLERESTANARQGFLNRKGS